MWASGLDRPLNIIPETAPIFFWMNLEYKILSDDKKVEFLNHGCTGAQVRFLHGEQGGLFYFLSIPSLCSNISIKALCSISDFDEARHVEQCVSISWLW